MSLALRAARSAAWRFASSGPAAVRLALRTGLTPRGAASAAAAAVAAPGPPWLCGDSGDPPSKPAARSLTECLCLKGSKVGASSGGRMRPRCGGSDSRDGEGSTSTSPSAGPRRGSTSTSPKRGTSAVACGPCWGELVGLAGGRRELWRLLSRLRETRPPVWRWRGEGTWLLARSESALLGERIGVALGAGLGWREPAVPTLSVGAGGAVSSASGRGLTRRALPSLWREEALRGVATAVRWRGTSGGLVSSAGAACAGAGRCAAATAGGGVTWRGCQWRTFSPRAPAGRSGRPRLDAAPWAEAAGGGAAGPWEAAASS